MATIKAKTYQEWLADQRITYVTDETERLYLAYLETVSQTETLATSAEDAYAPTLYKDFLRQIKAINEKPDTLDFIAKLNFDDPLELDLAVDYYAQQLVELAKDEANKKQEVQFGKLKNTLKASKGGVELYLRSFIIKKLIDNKFVTKAGSQFLNSNPNVPQTANAISIIPRTLVSNGASYLDQGVLDAQPRLDLEKRVEEEFKSGRVIQYLTTSQGGVLRMSNGKILTVRRVHSDYNKLPDRYFAGESKSLDTLSFNIKSQLSEKYLGNDVYFLSGNGESFDLQRIFKAENSNASITQRYQPSKTVSSEDLIDSRDVLPVLSLQNAGLARWEGHNITLSVDVSALSGRSFVIPDPFKIQPGFGLTKTKQQVPITFQSDNSEFKFGVNNSKDNIPTGKNSINGFGYQSRQNSLNYQDVGICRQEDNISFWSGEGQDIWKNDDTYPIAPLRDHPTIERSDDLLITNKTLIKWRTDIYGNEFGFYKKAYPKRQGGTQYDSVASSSSTGCTTAAQIHDALFFDATLSAIQANNATVFTELTSVYDQVRTYDNAACEGLSTFERQFDTIACSTLLTCEYLSTGQVLDCGGFNEDLVESTDNFFASGVPFKSAAIQWGTAYEASSLNDYLSAIPSLYTQNHVLSGELFIRNVHTNKVHTLYEGAASLFNKHNGTTMVHLISNSFITDFDILGGDTLFLQTSAGAVTEKFEMDGAKFVIKRPYAAIVTA